MLTVGTIVNSIGTYAARGRIRIAPATALPRRSRGAAAWPWQPSLPWNEEKERRRRIFAEMCLVRAPSADCRVGCFRDASPVIGRASRLRSGAERDQTVESPPLLTTEDGPAEHRPHASTISAEAAPRRDRRSRRAVCSTRPTHWRSGAAPPAIGPPQARRATASPSRRCREPRTAQSNLRRAPPAAPATTPPVRRNYPPESTGDDLNCGCWLTGSRA